MDLFAVTEAERIALFGIIAAVCAGIPGAVAAIYSAKTRKENVEQHGSSQRTLESVRHEVSKSSAHIEGLRDDVNALGEKIDGHSSTLAHHHERLRTHEKLLGGRDDQPDDPHPVL